MVHVVGVVVGVGPRAHLTRWSGKCRQARRSAIEAAAFCRLCPSWVMCEAAGREPPTLLLGTHAHGRPRGTSKAVSARAVERALPVGHSRPPEVLLTGPPHTLLRSVLRQWQGVAPMAKVPPTVRFVNPAGSERERRAIDSCLDGPLSPAVSPPWAAG